MPEPAVGIVVGSDSDLPVIRDACSTLEQLGIAYEVVIASAHRTPEKAVDYARSAAERGLLVLIGAAGGAAHLPGVLAAHTYLPVIGVPVGTGALNGVDALYSIVQMPAGVPVATVAIDGAKNAALLAARMIGITNPAVREKLIQYKNELAGQVQAKTARLAELGIERYLAELP
ncbi:MAG: 5-(carboxyamino)imidazole ribonucleotide mutase [Bacillota bacterium]